MKTWALRNFDIVAGALFIAMVSVAFIALAFTQGGYQDPAVKEQQRCAANGGVPTYVGNGVSVCFAPGVVR